MTEKNNDGKVFSKSETILLVIMSLLIGLTVGSLFNNNNSNLKNEQKTDDNIEEFIKNYNFIVDNYYEEVDKKKLINSAISGMMDSLNDPYSMYFNEAETNNFSITLNGSYQGFGLQITKAEEKGYLLVTGVFKNSSAEKVGIKAGDYIVSIDGLSSSDMSASDFTSTVINSDAKDFDIEILRGDETIKTKISKQTVTLTSVVSDYYEENDKKIGYIYIGIFANNTASQFKKELEDLEKKNIDYLIIDVRGNSGGHLTTVDSLLDIFLNSNQVMYGFERNNKKNFVKGTGKENKKYKIVLLGDSGSASASEVLIAGLKENLNSILIGKKTYGKGTVQELVTLNDGTQYKITVKKWLTPKGNWINNTKGIEPDIDVDMSDKYYETFDEKDDTQLSRALQYIKEN